MGCRLPAALTIPSTGITYAQTWNLIPGVALSAAQMAQLTSDKSRTAAHRFYGRLGYAASHEGFKRRL